MANPVEQWIEHETDRDKQRPAEHPAGERNVEQHERGKDHGIVEIHQRRQTEKRAQHDSRGELPLRALRVQRAEQRLDQLDQRQHGRFSRSSAIARISRRAVRRSSSRAPRSRASSTGTIASLDRRFTKTTKRNPNFCSYSSLRLARRKKTSGGVVSRSYPCSRKESADWAFTRSGLSPMRGCALITAICSGSGRAASISRARCNRSRVERKGCSAS